METMNIEAMNIRVKRINKALKGKYEITCDGYEYPAYTDEDWLFDGINDEEESALLKAYTLLEEENDGWQDLDEDDYQAMKPYRIF